MSAPGARPQDRLRLREGAPRPEERVIEPSSVALWTVVSLPIVGYFVWYYRAQRDCRRLLDDSSDPWFWMAMLFPGMILIVPYAVAQARIVARVEVATRTTFATATYLAVCAGGFFLPALLPLVLQTRLNRAARSPPGELGSLPIARTEARGLSG